ncbi:hypothetical protein [Bacillus sp. V33-4]|uniref:hypothetical protein n=1 Tax=Bacillus sp. V33-4 TaxID=2054169 RepID=UPI000C773BD0|nr:hypothetical protein [Bacillus sp. V33-4]PLR87233.1 hypothetical protein CVD23_03220 [Bacillus sp. V33-4]
MNKNSKGSKMFTNSRSSSRKFMEVEARSKTAHLQPDPHILHDDDKDLDLARIDGHKITIRENGTCESFFKVTSLGATPSGIYAAKLVYHFLDSDNNKIGKWDYGRFPVDCGDINVRRNPTGRYDGNLYDQIVDVICPVEGTWEWCDGDEDE